MATSTMDQVTNTFGWCASALEGGQHLFVLVDPPADTDPVFQPSPRHPQRNLFSGRTSDPLALQMGSRLIEVPADKSILQRLDRALARQSAEQPEMLLISSDLALDALANRLSHRFDINAAGEEMLLRLWDARIFLSLTTALAQPNRTRVFAFGTQALVPDRQGGYANVALTCPSLDPLQDARITLGQSELDALLERTCPDSVLAMVREISPDLIRKVADGERHSLARLQVLECEQRQLNSPRDQALALTLAIEHGPQWWHSPEWAGCVQQASQSTLLNAYRQRVRPDA